MRRREFLTLLGGVVAASPLAARTQQPMPVIGFLSTASSAEFLPLVVAFRQGLKEAGYLEGQNVLIEYRWAENQYDRLPSLAADLVHRQVQVIVAAPTASWTAAKSATTTIPIVFQGGGDPVKLGLVASLNRPGGNATGVINISSELAAKRLELLHEVVPSASQITALTNPNSPIAQHQLQDVIVAARTTQQEIYVVNASTEGEIDEAFAIAVRQQAGALLIITDALFTNRREQIVALAAQHTMPAIYPFRIFADAGGLISYGANVADEWHRTGIYTGRILKGEKPADLPVLLPTKFELVINLKTAKTLRIKIPDKLLALADEVIE
jgi:putative ABC transport system substrate-binding protein